MFGWNALALILKDQGIYSAGCAAERLGRTSCLQSQSWFNFVKKMYV